MTLCLFICKRYAKVVVDQMHIVFLLIPIPVVVHNAVCRKCLRTYWAVKISVFTQSYMSNFLLPCQFYGSERFFVHLKIVPHVVSSSSNNEEIKARLLQRICKLDKVTPGMHVA